MSETARVSGKAVASLALGVPSLLFLCTTGIPAFLLGYLALREINGSEGRVRGRGLAVAGIALGGLGTLATAVLLVVGALTDLNASARRAGCVNNLRLVGLALNTYHEEHKHYPAGTLPRADLAPERRLSWLVALLPYLELEQQQRTRSDAVTAFGTVYAAINRDLPWDAAENRDAVATTVRPFLCPANDNRAPPGAPGLTHYVGVAGVGEDAAALPAGHRDAGVFGHNRTTDRETILAGRGTSETMMAAETSDSGPWAAGGYPTVRGLDPARRPYLGRGRQFGGVHRGGLNVLFADGSVRFLSEGIEPRVLEAHARVAADEF